MAFSELTMSDSFFMSNMSPQVPAFNRGIWAKLEAQIRIFAITEKEIYIVTGPVLPKEKSITIGESRVTVPAAYYKVVYDLTPPQKMIGFILPNEGSTRDLKDYAVTVNAVEDATGLNFFSLVPQPQQEELESSSSIDDWKWGK
jgi:endonuclease G